MGEARQPGPQNLGDLRDRALAALPQLGLTVARRATDVSREAEGATATDARQATGSAAENGSGGRPAAEGADSNATPAAEEAERSSDRASDEHSLPSRPATPASGHAELEQASAEEAAPAGNLDRQPRRLLQLSSARLDVAAEDRVQASASQAAADARPGSRAPTRAAWDRWATADYEAALREPVLTMKEPPRWFRGSLLRAYLVALEEWERSKSTASWALVLFTPRLLLTPTAKQGAEGKEELTERLERFLRGEWTDLLAKAQRNGTRQDRARGGETAEAAKERKLEAACNRVRNNEASRARELLTSSGLAPGNADTLAELRDPARRPTTLSRAIPVDVLTHEPAVAFALDAEQLWACLSTAKKGRAADLFGTRLEHLRVLLDSGPGWAKFVSMAQAFAKAEVPAEVVHLMRLGRMTALKKRDGRARGIVTGCAFRRLVCKAIARQSASAFRDATAPFQFALQTRAGMDALVHAIRALTDANTELVVLSLDGIGAFDHVRRAAFLKALRDDPTLSSLLPLVKALYTNASTYLWTDDRGEVHEVTQGEGGEQGDPLMPALFALGQHSALQAAATQLLPGEQLFAYLDDLYVVCTRERAAAAFKAVADSVYAHAGVKSHLGKLRAWSRGGGEAPADLAALGPNVWTANLEPEHNGLMVLGSPVGSAEYVRARGVERLEEEKELLHILPELPDTQCAWILLALCAVPRANHLLRTVPPTQVETYAQEHDAELWEGLNKLLGSEADAAEDHLGLSRKLATLPARYGGLGLRSAARTRTAAYWAAWVDALSVLKEKRPALAELLLSKLDLPADQQPRCLLEATAARNTLLANGYPEAPTWRQAADGAVAPQPQNAEAGEWPHGWQFHASSALEHTYRNNVVLHLASPKRKALIRSQSGHAAGKWLTTAPTCPELTLSPLRMQVVLRLRLHYKLPMGPRRCNGNSCRAMLDAYGEHWSACNRSGRLKLRSLPLERTWARVFREAGARVQCNVFLRDTNLEGVAADDGRRLEIVATGLPLFRGAPLGVDCTMTAPLHADGRPWLHADTTDGVAVARGEDKKLRTYPELVNNSRLRLTTLACETGGRWSVTCCYVVRQLATAKARQAPEEKRSKVAAGWASRWWGMLSVAGRNALAGTLVDDAPSLLDGTDGQEPDWHEVLRDSNPGTVLGDLRGNSETELPTPGGRVAID